jgi:hypothetical protein
MPAKTAPPPALALRSLFCTALLPACGAHSSVPPTSAEVELAAPFAPPPSALVVATAEDEPRPARMARGGAVSHEPCVAAARLRSIHSETSLHLDFVNRTAGAVSLHWIDFNGKLVHYIDIEAGETHHQQTYVTHPWIALDRDEQCRGVFVPNGPGVHTVLIGAR